MRRHGRPARAASDRRQFERGSALVLAVVATTLLLALGAALLLVSTTETRIASRFARGVETRAAAEAVLDRALLDLFAIPDWTMALTGAATSAFTDGPPAGPRTIGDTTIDLDTATNVLRCGRPMCEVADMTAATATRPWGRNNARWQLFAWGRVSALAAVPPDRDAYVLVWVGDDPAETDGDPLRDGEAEENPGRWTVILTAHAFGAGERRRAIEATVTRRTPVPPPRNGDPLTEEAAAGPGPARVITWSEVR